MLAKWGLQYTHGEHERLTSQTKCTVDKANGQIRVTRRATTGPHKDPHTKKFHKRGLERRDNTQLGDKPNPRRSDDAGSMIHIPRPFITTDDISECYKRDTKAGLTTSFPTLGNMMAPRNASPSNTNIPKHSTVKSTKTIRVQPREIAFKFNCYNRHAQDGLQGLTSN
ncbi:hypothetical protein Ae201684_017853 [Aphanomyces euteiches]|uniref:Uncharacterized protein n=1 Tax=Aphanomyces euteiches TaxID=100861 RepID=A0A6G0W7Z8_9STRA|nr:hypothetical protein Ae201684_017853 [Aphanomyces euteiches]